MNIFAGMKGESEIDLGVVSRYFYFQVRCAALRCAALRCAALRCAA